MDNLNSAIIKARGEYTQKLYDSFLTEIKILLENEELVFNKNWPGVICAIDDVSIFFELKITCNQSIEDINKFLADKLPVKVVKVEALYLVCLSINKGEHKNHPVILKFKGKLFNHIAEKLLTKDCWGFYTKLREENRIIIKDNQVSNTESNSFLSYITATLAQEGLTVEKTRNNNYILIRLNK